MDFCRDRQRRQGVDATKATEPGHYLCVGLLGRPVRELLIQCGQTTLVLLEREKVIVQDILIGDVLEAQPAKPVAMSFRPHRTPARPADRTPQQKLRQSVLDALLIPLHA